MSNCNDPLACNFNPKSCFDEENGNCCYVTGCMDGAFGVNNDVNGNDMNGVPCPYPCSNGFFWDNYDPEACCESKCCKNMGCTDPTSFNYDPTADCDDGSCCYVSGCTDSVNGLYPDIFGNGIDGTPCSWPCINATGFTGYQDSNYNPEACFDSNCPDIVPIYGCMDEDAFNYYAGATEPCNHIMFTCVMDVSGNTQQIYDPTGLGYNISGCCCCYIQGCTDPTACNYLSGACHDDGSCVGLLGCMNPTACNYNSGATCGDGSCIVGTGCTDPSAVNYFSGACFDDGSCCYSGCTDPSASNYNAIFCVDDGSCCYLGCTDPLACNYSVTACVDDGSCLTNYGCMIASAYNYDPLANCPTTCCYVTGCTDPSAINYNSLACMSATCCYSYGCQDPAACNYTLTACSDPSSCCYVCGCTDPDDGTSVIPNNDSTITGFATGPFNYNPAACFDDGSCCYVAGCMDPTAVNYNSLACFNDGSCIAVVYGCTDPLAYNYYPGATVDDGSCCYIAGCMDSISGACNYNPAACFDDGTYCCYVTGCTDPTAINYFSGACCNVGCCYGGCTDPLACNYDPTACADDGSCNDIYGCMNATAFNYEPLANCPTSCCFDAGCTDPTAYNYDPTACFNDGSCCYIAGCTDPLYCSYDVFACYDDGTCCDITGCTNNVGTFNYDPTACCDCNSDPLGTFNSGWSGCCCTVEGCTNPTAVNYFSGACSDDGSCVYGISGCTNTGATNYNPAATIDDGSCFYLGCTNSGATNYNPSATVDDGSCLYCNLFKAVISATTCTSGGSGTTLCTGTIVATASGGSSSYTYQVFNGLGVLQDPLALCLGNYNVTVTDTVHSCTDAISGVTIGYDGCTFPGSLNYDPNATCDDGCIPCSYGCMDDGCCTDGTVNVVGTPCPNGAVPGTHTWHLCPTIGSSCDDPGPSYNSPFLLFLSGVTSTNLNVTVNTDTGCLYRNCLDPTSGNYDFASTSPFDCIGVAPVFPAVGDTRCCCYGTTPMPPYEPCCLSGNTSVPDVIFETFIETQSWYTCATAPSGEVVNDCICPITFLDAKGINIASLVGIEGFVNLEQLFTTGDLLTSLDLTGNVFLNKVSTESNLLTSIDISTCVLLDFLWCHNNQLTSLDVSTNVLLTTLNCDNNQLTSLDVSNNTILEGLSCQLNQLTTIDLSTNTALIYLYIAINQLTSLDLSTNTALTNLFCPGNQFTSLDVSNNIALTYLACNQNQITSLDVSTNTVLTHLVCSGNQIPSLDVTNNPALVWLECNNNQLTSVDLGSTIDLSTLHFIAVNNGPGMVVHVGTVGRVATANIVFTPGVHIDVGTIFTI